MIARALQGEEADDHEEQNEMHGRRQETARDKEVVGEVDQDINQGEIAGPAVGDDKVEMGYKLVSAEQERKTDENDGGKVELSGGGEGGEAAEYEQKKRDIEIALNGVGHGDSAGVAGNVGHGKVLLLAKAAWKGSGCGNTVLAP